ncbi:RHS repeat domain-containing protein [Pseudomonas fluorescens]|uniref:RHS repeat domain-containing protein n=1 Tax=Pseudomonas fluorescens TaxID=294 RepID=UPI0009C115B1|nr:RHS repeat-associated core domain-containing protein [Pseudomonas fluorescens]
MGVDHRTPTLTVSDPRRLAVRSVGYCRSLEGSAALPRINRSLFDVAGRAVKQWDPRLWTLQQTDESAPANLSAIHSLSGTLLHTDSVDAGIQIGLPGLAAEGLLGWDARGTQQETLYDDLLRPVAVFEQGASQPRRCTERMTYGYPGQDNQDLNLYGQLIRHDDPAGTLLLVSFALAGENLVQDRRFILDAAPADWPELEADREFLLEPGDGAVSTWRVGPLGDVLEQVDARGNRQRQSLTLDGRLFGSQLQLAGQGDWLALVSDIRYDAFGQIEQEASGNGLRTTLTYSPEDGRLIQRHAVRVDQVLQHLLYDYDPMGNVLNIEDQAQPVRHFANQRIEPVSRFVYDSLYQLIEATGWEAGMASQGPESAGRNDPAAVSNYRQTYRYDEAGNLLELTHVGAQSHGRQMKAARYSNRCLLYRNGMPPTEEEIAVAFDARGNCLELDVGRFLAWDLRNQLSSVTPIERASGFNDSESYVYDGGGQRVRKLRTLQTGARTLAAEVRYLPGLKLHADSGTGEALQVIVAPGGLSSVQILHWESPPPTGENDCYRYSVADHLGSVGLELAQDGRIISREHFYPFGETAYLVGEDAIEVSYKTVRYSGKERDATGFYYYGFRYYIPWLQRWVNPDPVGQVDGLNLFRMLRNCPLSYKDDSGGNSFQVTADNRFDVLNESETKAINEGSELVARGLDYFPAAARQKVNDAFAEGEFWLREATKELSSSTLSRSTKKLLEKIFGEDALAKEEDIDNLRTPLQQKLSDLSNYLRDLKENNGWRLGLAKFERGGITGRTAYNNTQSHNIWLSLELIENSHALRVASTLVHEAAHAMYLGEGQHVHDFWYLPEALPADATSEDIDTYPLLKLLMSEDVVSEGPVEERMNPHGRKAYEGIINVSLKQTGQSPATSPSERREAFVKNPRVRAAVIMRNADSYPGLLMNFRRKN